MGRRQARSWRWIVLAALLCVYGCILLQASPRERRSKRAYGGNDFTFGAKPELLNADTNPTLRYPVLNLSGTSIFSISYGWFDITRDKVRYSVVEPEKKRSEGFEASLSEIDEIKIQHGHLRFMTSGKQRTVLYLPPERWGTIHSGFGLTQAVSNDVISTMAIGQALTNFDRVLASVKPPPPAPASPTPSANTPTPAPVPEEPSVPPTVVLVEPSVSGPNQTVEVGSPTLTVRGVAMDPSGIPVVTVNGTHANMKPRDTHAAEFWSDPLTLQPGDNRVEVDATNAAHVEAKVVFLARLTTKAPSPPPNTPPSPPNPEALGKAEILSFLRNNLGSANVADLVKKYGIKFSPTEGDLKEIREAGGSADLIEAIKQAAAAAVQ